MNLRHILIAISLFAICKATADSPYPVFPTSLSGPEFEKQAEAFIIKRSYSGESSSPPVREQLKSDPRDWEPVLEKLIREPSEYPAIASQAFGYSRLRGKSKDPRIVEASGVWFDHEVQRAVVTYDKYSGAANLKDMMVSGSFRGMVYQILDANDPAYLALVLDYLDTPAEEKIRLLVRKMPEAIATAIRTYGDATNIAGAKKLVAKLRGLGRNDVADDIDRSIKRIEKDVRIPASSSKDSASAAKHPVSGESAKTFSGSFWLYLSITVAVLLGGLVFFKRRAA